MAGRSDCNCTRNLPEYILCLCTACQDNIHSRTHLKGSCNLEYPNIVRTARNCNICWDDNRTREFIKTWCKCFASNVSGSQIHKVRIGTSCSVGVCCLHVPYGSG